MTENQLVYCQGGLGLGHMGHIVTRHTNELSASPIIHYSTLAATAAESPGDRVCLRNLQTLPDTPEPSLKQPQFLQCAARERRTLRASPQATVAGIGVVQLLHISVVIRHHKVFPMHQCAVRLK